MPDSHVETCKPRSAGVGSPHKTSAPPEGGARCPALDVVDTRSLVQPKPDVNNVQDVHPVRTTSCRPTDPGRRGRRGDPARRTWGDRA